MNGFQATGEASSPPPPPHQKREHPALQNMKFLHFFLIFQAQIIPYLGVSQSSAIEKKKQVGGTVLVPYQFVNNKNE